MFKSTRSITLALVGTASVALIGTTAWVANSNPPTEEEKKQQAANGHAGTTHRGGGFFFMPFYGGSLGRNSVGRSGGSVAPSPSPSSRGGFGSTGSVSASS